MASTAIVLPDGDFIRSLVARQISASTGDVVRWEDLAGGIQDITIETQILGASLLKIPFIDPDWALLDTGIFNPTGDGLLPEVDIEFPPSTGWKWRLCQLTVTVDRTQTHMLTFQDRIVAYLRNHFGARGWSGGVVGKTRADFIKTLVDEVGRGAFARAPFFETPIRFVCPSLNVVQPIQSKAGTTASQTIISTAQQNHVNKTKVNKLPGLTNPQLLTGNQQVFAYQLASQTGLDPVVVAAWEYAEENGTFAIAREVAKNNNWLNIGYFDSGAGPIAFAQAFNNPTTAANQTALFLKGQWGGASAQIQAILKAVGKSPATQINAIWTSNWASSHYNNGTNLTGAYEALTGKTPGSVPTGTFAAAGTSAPVADLFELTRGTSQNPDEDSWDCIQRLAQQVGWYAFTYGNTLFYMDGDDLVAQNPAIYLQRLRDRGNIPSLSATWDNTTFQYLSDHKRKARIQRKSRISKPMTPSEVTMSFVCDITDLRAGDAIVFQQFGPVNGRWIISDATRNCLSDTFTQFTIQPPLAPFAEPAASGNVPLPNSSSNQPTTASGTNYANAGDAALAALKNVTDHPTRSLYVGKEVRPIPASLWGPYPVVTDCSGFAILCYKAAGLEDPSGNMYNGAGYTGDLLAHCDQVGAGSPGGGVAQPGDLCFFGPAPVPIHVTVYVGNGQAVGMNPAPPHTGAATVGPADFIGFWRPRFLTTPFPSPAGATPDPFNSQTTNPFRRSVQG